MRHVGGSLLPSNNSRILQPVDTPTDDCISRRAFDNITGGAL